MKHIIKTNLKKIMLKTFINMASFMKKNINIKMYWMNPIYMV
jgi:hypothetical protein